MCSALPFCLLGSLESSRNERIQALRLVARSCRYSAEYAPADRFQEKSFPIPRTIRDLQNSAWEKARAASRIAANRAGPESSANLNPVPSSIVSFRPPVARTTGMVPYLRL